MPYACPIASITRDRGSFYIDSVQRSSRIVESSESPEPATWSTLSVSIYYVGRPGQGDFILIRLLVT